MPETMPGLVKTCDEVPGCAVAGFFDELEIGRTIWKAVGVTRKGARADVGLTVERIAFVNDLGLEMQRIMPLKALVARTYLAAPGWR